MARKPTAGTPTAMPPAAPIAMPPLTPEELAAEREIIRNLQEATTLLRQRNLDNAVRLAQAVALGQGPAMPRLVELGLVDHFCELGRRFGDELDKPPSRPRLRVVKDGAA